MAVGSGGTTQVSSTSPAGPTETQRSEGGSKTWPEAGRWSARISDSKHKRTEQERMKAAISA
jgi:hypothetical protein